MLLTQRLRQSLVLVLMLVFSGGLLFPTRLTLKPRLQGQSASAAAMGNAFVAQADDPLRIALQPAGMTQLHGFQTLFGTSLIGGTTHSPVRPALK